MARNPTPTTEDVRWDYSLGSREEMPKRAQAFDAWLAAHDAEVRKQALETPRAVAHHWKQALMGMLDEHPLLAAGTHALAMVETALDGATNPADLGMTDSEMTAAIRALGEAR